ncbi:tetratricopeptide repeat protein [Streptomyces sp. NPDC058268]|uniref:tetratricopeptide repeat protein n=2 Tax=unclassified Streptomyces TaxID=2593676 RepID=UPI0036EC5DE7
MEIETGSESVTQKEQRPPPEPAPAPASGSGSTAASTSAVWSESPRGARRSPSLRRVLAASVAGCVVLGGVVVVLRPDAGGKAAPPALGPAGRAMAAAGAGVPAALPDLTVLIGEREAHLKKHPGDDQSWAVLGAAYVERGLRTADSAYYPRAEDALRTSLKTRPEGNAQALTGMAALANARHDFRGAKKWAQKAVAQAPKRWSTYPVLIDAYSGLGDAKGVGKALDTLKELNSGTSVMARAGQVYRDRGWREDAASKLMDAAALAEGSAEKAACLYRVGELAWERGEPKEALRYYDAALRSDPDHHPSLAGKGRALAALGRTSEALRSYQSALVRQPAPEYALALGELYESLRLTPAARAQYDVLRARVKQEGVNGVNDERILGLFEADHGDADEAVDRLRAEFKRHGSPEAADALGWALHRAGEDEEALKYATRATDKGPRIAAFSYHRGEIERDLERYGAARRHIGEALLLNPYFSPLLAPKAREALDSLGDPPEGGPAEMYAANPPEPPTPPPTTSRPAPKPTAPRSGTSTSKQS